MARPLPRPLLCLPLKAQGVEHISLSHKRAYSVMGGLVHGGEGLGGQIMVKSQKGLSSSPVTLPL